MSMDETKLTCPYCGAHYQAKDSVCLRCGKTLSPTGYSRYGESEPVAQQPAPLPAMLARSTSSRVGGIDRPHNRDTQIQAWHYYLPIGVIIVLIIIFFILNGPARRVTYPDYPNAIAVAYTPTPLRPFACLPPPEATLYSVLPRGAPTDDTQSTRAPRADNTPIPNAVMTGVRVSYILNINTAKGILQAKMYYIGPSAVNQPPVTQLRGALSSFGDGLVTIFTGNGSTTDFTPTNLPYRCGSVLMLVSNGRLGDDQLTIIRSDDPAGALTFAQKYGFTYTVVGQLISGYDVLGALSAGDMVNGASVSTP